MTLTADITALTVDMTLTVDIALAIDNRHEFTEKKLDYRHHDFDRGHYSDKMHLL